VCICSIIVSIIVIHVTYIMACLQCCMWCLEKVHTHTHTHTYTYTYTHIYTHTYITTLLPYYLTTLLPYYLTILLPYYLTTLLHYCLSISSYTTLLSFYANLLCHTLFLSFNRLLQNSCLLCLLDNEIHQQARLHPHRHLRHRLLPRRLQRLLPPTTQHTTRSCGQHTRILRAPYGQAAHTHRYTYTYTYITLLPYYLTTLLISYSIPATVFICYIALAYGSDTDNVSGIVAPLIFTFLLGRFHMPICPYVIIIELHTNIQI
jgi:hypothetical protein